MAEFNGPGVITRIWSANPGKDRWRIYLDGSDKPVVDEIGEILLSGKGPHFKKPFAGSRSMGYLLLFPMPFAKSCKVALFSAEPKKPSRYFQIDISTLPKDAEVETFQLEDLKKYSAKIAETAKAMDERQPPKPSAAKAINFDQQIKPGGKIDLAAPAGPAIIKLIEIKINAEDKKALRQILSQVVVSGYFDDSKKAIHLCPAWRVFRLNSGSEPLPIDCLQHQLGRKNQNRNAPKLVAHAFPEISFHCAGQLLQAVCKN